MDYQQQNLPEQESQAEPTTQAPIESSQVPPAAVAIDHKPLIKKPKLPISVMLALLIFTLVSAFVLSLLPHLSRKTPNMPSFGILLISGLVMVAFTAILFSVLNKLNLGFSKTAIIMAFGYNAVIAIIKFVISPRALYLSNQNNPFNKGLASPNTVLYYIVTGAIILLLYVGMFWLIYKHFRKRIEKQLGQQVVKPQHHYNTKAVVLFSVGAVGFVAIGGVAIIFPYLLLGSFSSLSYLGYVFSALGIPLLLAIVLAIFMAYKGFAAVEKQVLVTGNTALLASFLWLGVSLIILYHILWIVFMLTLVHIWPFNTYSPK